MKRNTIIILSLTSLFVFFGCTKEINIETETTLPDENTALSDFAEILSSAVYSELPLRDFIKSEALKEFDRDFDVFYPFVKDEIVYDNQTFRQILEKYDTKGLLQEIEAREPLLNILVPDWSWVDEECFSVCNWDVANPDVLVTYECPGSLIPLYGKGELLGSMQGNEFPSIPVLVVKRNERMVYQPTKSGPLMYDFDDPAYDGSQEVKTKGIWYDDVYDFDILPPSNTVHPLTLPSKVRVAYTESKKNSLMKQRDHIYYDMTAVRDTGMVDIHYSEELYRFCFASGNIPALTDDPMSGDNMSLNEISYNYGQAMSEEALKTYGWIEGRFELIITVKAGEHLEQIVLPSIQISDAFAVDKVHYTWYEDIFGVVTYRWYRVEQSELVPRWIVINHELFTWDLSIFPYSYTVHFEEKDSDMTTTYTQTATYSYATNFTLSGEGSASTVKIGFGSGSSSQTSRSSTVTLTQNEGSDDLGTEEVYYSDAVVLSMPGSQPKAQLKSYTTESIVFQVVPRNSN